MTGGSLPLAITAPPTLISMGVRVEWLMTGGSLSSKYLERKLSDSTSCTTLRSMGIGGWGWGGYLSSKYGIREKVVRLCIMSPRRLVHRNRLLWINYLVGYEWCLNVRFLYIELESNKSKNIEKKQCHVAEHCPGKI